MFESGSCSLHGFAPVFLLLQCTASGNVPGNILLTLLKRLVPLFWRKKIYRLYVTFYDTCSRCRTLSVIRGEKMIRTQYPTLSVLPQYRNGLPVRRSESVGSV